MNYTQIAKEARIKVLSLIYEAQVSHIGSNFSAVDIMAVLFEKMDLGKDKFVLSSGWKAASLYYFLWKKGIITEKELNSFCKPDSRFIGLAEPMGRFGLEIGGGSMGLGLPGAVGLALAKKMKGEEGTVYALMSDGEMQCGTTWESVLIAAHHKLNNLVVIVDANGFQAMGKTREILSASFPLQGWEGISINGHHFGEIEKSLEDLTGDNLPKVIMANTIKGKGVSKFEGNNLYHYKQLNKEEYENALTELDG